MLIGSKIIYREKVSSTNDLATEMLAADTMQEGTVIYAGEQTGGKGQRGNKWITEAGKNLTLSIILYPSFLEADQQFLISKVMSLSIAGLLDGYSDSISIKWPNDIYHKDDKIAGILIENSIEGNKLKKSIIGAGININQVNFPPGIPNPVSINIINNREYSTGELLSELCRISDQWYSRLREGQFDYINTEYYKRLYRLNKQADFNTPAGIVRGRITGVDSFGRIEVEMENGNTEVYGFREIEFTG